jgi:hypothetical protein
MDRDDGKTPPVSFSALGGLLRDAFRLDGWLCFLAEVVGLGCDMDYY